ncbi:MAG: hypothetical protein HS132_15360 [Planctomycetia bacterium]|nr:hypothetical protein [Planctomycetia bacterium]
MTTLAYSTDIKSSFRGLKIGVFLIFIAINIEFIVGDIIKPLILIDVIQTSGHEHRYEFHTPSLPDICGDVVAIILIGAGYLFITSSHLKNTMKGMMYTSCETDNPFRKSIEERRNYILWAKNIFIMTTLGFSLYFFSKYILTTGLEVFFPEESESFNVLCILSVLNSILTLGASVIFVYAYCKYISVGNHIKILLYCFFFTRNLFFTNMLGFVHEYDIEAIAPLLDALLPAILIYSTISILTAYRLQHRYQFGDMVSLEVTGKSDISPRSCVRKHKTPGPYNNKS